MRLTQARGAMLLVVASALWGSSFVVIRQLSAAMPASAVCLARFAIAAVALGAFISFDAKTWKIGLELAVWLFAGYATQAIALRYTSVNRCAFITAMYVVMTPMLAAFFGERVRWIVWSAAICALVGCGLMCAQGGGPNVGDVWSLGTAVTWAVYIFRMEHAAKFSPIPLAVAQLVPMTLFSGVWLGVGGGHVGHVANVPWGLVIYLGLGCTAATTFLQAVAQRVVPSPQAAVIFSLDPVFAAIFGFIFLGEGMGARELSGAVLIIGAAFLCQVPQGDRSTLARESSTG